MHREQDPSLDPDHSVLLQKKKKTKHGHASNSLVSVLPVPFGRGIPALTLLMLIEKLTKTDPDQAISLFVIYYSFAWFYWVVRTPAEKARDWRTQSFSFINYHHVERFEYDL
jgi:hypothetical protein